MHARIIICNARARARARKLNAQGMISDVMYTKLTHALAAYKLSRRTIN